MDNAAEIVLDIDYYGYGVGLVLLGYLVGVVLALIISALNKAKYV